MSAVDAVRRLEQGLAALRVDLEHAEALAEARAGVERAEAVDGPVTAAAFGRRVVALRKALGMSQADLARALGMLPPVVCVLESGRRWPTVDTLIKMCRVLECSASDLLGV
jgi:DNA-binding XRE family transcriptional regulator